MPIEPLIAATWHSWLSADGRLSKAAASAPWALHIATTTRRSIGANVRNARSQPIIPYIYDLQITTYAFDSFMCG